jgi:NDP-sugar pyrophosphorylase family protein
MIVAAGLGTRLQPFTHWRPKPAVPVRGLPLIAYPLALLARAGVTEVVINVHHLPRVLQAAAEAFAPPGLRLHFSGEDELLHTGGAIRRVSSFLRESDPCLVLGGDMIVDLDLPGLIQRHTHSGRSVTALMTQHPRAAEFGTIGLDGEGRLRRIGERIDWGREEQAGVYTWVNVLSARAFDTLPERDSFSHLDDWWVPWAEREPDAVGGEVLTSEQCRWIPVGTPAEYLDANLALPALSYLDVDRTARAIGARFESRSVIGAGAQLGEDVVLEDAVIWDGELVPAGSVLKRGVFAGGRFHPTANADAGAAS